VITYRESLRADYTHWSVLINIRLDSTLPMHTSAELYEVKGRECDFVDVYFQLVKNNHMGHVANRQNISIRSCYLF